MKRAIQIAAQLQQIETIHQLTDVFESVASMRIARIKDQVLASNEFFNELWALYSSLRIKTRTPVMQALDARRTSRKIAFVLITSESGLSGDIDRRIIERMKSDYQANKVDLIVVGYHGMVLLQQEEIKYKRSFRLPNADAGVDVTPVITELNDYKETYIYYQRFVSLAEQKVDRIALLSAVESLSRAVPTGQATISPEEYIFEPSIDEVVMYLESTMMGIALGQTLLESRLSQLASRFNAMSQAEQRAQDLSGQLKRAFFSAKRALSDQHIREISVAMEVQ